jgi:hypothetical protein
VVFQDQDVSFECLIYFAENHAYFQLLRQKWRRTH